MQVFIDIETIPDQSEGAINRFMEGPAKCPHKTKGAIGDDLGMTPEQVKFIGLEDLKQKWIDTKGEEAVKIQAEEKWLKTSFDGAYGQIICIGYSVNGNKPECLSISDFGTEADLLVDFWRSIMEGNQRRDPQFVAHNAKFDLPFLWHRSVINGVNPNCTFDPNARQGKLRYCTMEAWAGFNGMIGLDRLCGILGVKGKTEGITGADVWPEYQKGNIEKIKDYCKDDVSALIEVYNRLNFK